MRAKDPPSFFSSFLIGVVDRNREEVAVGTRRAVLGSVEVRAARAVCRRSCERTIVFAIEYVKMQLIEGTTERVDTIL